MSLPVWRPSKPFKLRHLSVCCPRNAEKRKSKWLVGYHDTPPRSQPKPHLCEHHLIGSTSLTSPTYTINMTKSWSPTTAYKPHAITKITTHAKGYLIKFDRSSVTFLRCQHDCYTLRNDFNSRGCFVYSGENNLQWQ